MRPIRSQTRRPLDRAEVNTGRYDAVIVGAGHNGLVAASYLADAGLRVLVAERRSLVGGACVTEELIPGTRSSSCAFVAAPGLHPKLIRDLRLHRLGLRLYQTDVSTCIVHEPGASRVVLWAEVGGTLRELRERFGATEASGLIHLGARLRRFATLMRRDFWGRISSAAVATSIFTGTAVRGRMKSAKSRR